MMGQKRVLYRVFQRRSVSGQIAEHTHYHLVHIRHTATSILPAFLLLLFSCSPSTISCARCRDSLSYHPSRWEASDSLWLWWWDEFSNLYLTSDVCNVHQVHVCYGVSERVWISKRVITMVSGRLNVTSVYNEQIKLLVLEEIHIWLAYTQPESGFIWPDTSRSYNIR